MKARREAITAGGKNLDEVSHSGQFNEEAYEGLPHSSRQLGRLLNYKSRADI